MSTINHKLNTKDILARVGAVIGIKKNKAIAAELGVKPSVCSNWKTRNAIPWNELLNFSISHSVSLIKLLTGQKQNPNIPSNGYTAREIQHMEDSAAANKKLNEYLVNENKQIKRQVKVLKDETQNLQKRWTDDRRQEDPEDLDVAALRK